MWLLATGMESVALLLRGIIPLLERWLGNLIARQFEGRRQNDVAKQLPSKELTHTTILSCEPKLCTTY